MSAACQRGTVRTELLPDGEVHLWLLPRDDGLLVELAAVDYDLLSPAERTRLRSFRNPLLGRRFLVQRVLLRRGLSHYVGVEPGRLVFTHGPRGKPDLKHPSCPYLSFNLSHCGATAVLAVARGHRLGVDLESLMRAETALRISKRCFSDPELLHLVRCGESASHEALKLWVLKESIVKAVGDTVWDGLSKVAVSIEKAEIGWLAPPPEGDEKDWILMLGQLRGTHVLAVALNAKAAQIRPYAWRAYTLGTDQPSETDVELLLTSVAPSHKPILS